METTQIISLILNAVLSVGFITAIATLRSTRRKAREEARRASLENDKSLMDSFNQYIVEPLKKEVNALRKDVRRFTRAVEKINECPHAVDCPVRNELQNTKDDDNHAINTINANHTD